MKKVRVPPIKSQGIKTKLVPLIRENVVWDRRGRWVEPFLGSGVVGFNLLPQTAMFCDSNPHVVGFYTAINDGEITAGIVRDFLEKESPKLEQCGADYYYEVRERFNGEGAPLDFLFLNRSCFNGVIRFNRSGQFNVPYGHKPERFSKSYITKIVNQVAFVEDGMRNYDWTFHCQDFQATLGAVHSTDFVYCDPPYIGRHVDYYNNWDEESEKLLFELLRKCPANFMLSTWYGNSHRNNGYFNLYWKQFRFVLREHYYHVGAKETNRKPMIEALVMNYDPPASREIEAEAKQLSWL